MKRRSISLLAAVSLAAGACAGPWTVYVYNNGGGPIGVRLRLPSDERTWVLQPQQADTLVRAAGSRPVTVELFDPEDCTVLATEALPEGPGVLAVLSQGVSGDGHWQIVAAIDRAGESPVFEPNFDGCS